jgi:hypothetical protein
MLFIVSFSNSFYVTQICETTQQFCGIIFLEQLTMQFKKRYHKRDKMNDWPNHKLEVDNFGAGRLSE